VIVRAFHATATAEGVDAYLPRRDLDRHVELRPVAPAPWSRPASSTTNRSAPRPEAARPVLAGVEHLAGVGAGGPSSGW
jgi:hypothetical protein